MVRQVAFDVIFPSAICTGVTLLVRAVAMLPAHQVFVQV